MVILRYVWQFLNHARLFATPWTVVHQLPLSMGFSRQEYWSRLPFPSLGDLPDPGIESASLVSPALGGGFSDTVSPRKMVLKDSWWHHPPLFGREVCQIHLQTVSTSTFMKTLESLPLSVSVSDIQSQCEVGRRVRYLSVLGSWSSLI